VPALDIYSCVHAWGVFNKCYKLTKVEFLNWNLLSRFHGGICEQCYSLRAFVVRSFRTTKEFKTSNLTDCYHFHGTVDATYNPNGDKDGYIYVPRANVEELKSATGWSAFGDQIRALEDYTVDGTTTGALMEGLY
jgi:hypothetical protein